MRRSETLVEQGTFSNKPVDLAFRVYLIVARGIWGGGIYVRSVPPHHDHTIIAFTFPGSAGADTPS